MASTTLPPTAKWILAERNHAVEEDLKRELGIPGILASLLAQRGIATPQDADRFLRCSLDDLHDGSLLPDYVAARDAILGAKERAELIFVHGDYDVDGVTSAATFDRFLKKIGCKVITHVPHRMKEGYGIHTSAVDAAIASGAKLFLTCDCGSGALEQVAKARAAGMTVVVTDHHTFGDQLPDAHAFINPHRLDSVYPFRELSGAGVVFKLCAALTKELGIDSKFYYRNFLDLAALGTIADVMPLVGENRIIAKHGLDMLGKTNKVGLQALMDRAEVDMTKPLTNYHVGFVLGPRLNAAGRIDDAAMALQLLIEGDKDAATNLAELIEQSNIARKAEQNRIIEEALDMVEREGLANNRVIVVAKEGWHAGVVGIVASRIVETYHRPAFVMTIDPVSKTVKGSARSIPNFHLADAIRSMPELMTGGGHAMAAGGAFALDNLDQVRQAMHGRGLEQLTEDDLVPTRGVDLEIATTEINLKVAESLALMEPFGVANPEPSYVSRNMTVVEKKPCKDPAHVQLTLRQAPDRALRSIAFHMGDRFESVAVGSTVDVVYKAEINHWRGNAELKFKIEDFR